MGEGINKIMRRRRYRISARPTGEVQENPAAARVGVEDADCQRVSEGLSPAKRVSGRA